VGTTGRTRFLILVHVHVRIVNVAHGWRVSDEKIQRGRGREREREIERDRRMRGDGMRGREKGNREWNCFSSSAPSVIFFSSSIYFFYLFLVLRFSYFYAVCYGYTWAMKISLHSLQSCKHSGVVKILFVKQYTYHINILLIYWIFINYENFICIKILIQFA